MNLDEYKSIIDSIRDDIIEWEAFTAGHPETGFKEWTNHAYIFKKLQEWGYDAVEADGIPGLYADIDTRKAGASVLVLAELDAITCFGHPLADKITGAAHACGHNVQCAALLAVAYALKQKGALDGLSGRIRFCFVPAEELIETDFRRELIEKGVIHYMGGKVEMLYRGWFDGFDVAFMVHVAEGPSGMFYVDRGSNGNIMKNVLFIGKAAHAGACPWEGINALNAAVNGLNIVNSLRETFRDEDRVRVHGIITNGGSAPNTVPDSVRLEYKVRAASLKGMTDANRKVNRALSAAAAAVGARVRISDRLGYMPLRNDRNLTLLAIKAMKEVVDESGIRDNYDNISGGCTDMGDLSAIIPCVHLYASGASGHGHGSDYEVSDIDSACLNPAKLQLALLKLLLEDGGREAKRISKDFKPVFKDKSEYFDALAKLQFDGETVEYLDDGSIAIRAFGR